MNRLIFALLLFAYSASPCGAAGLELSIKDGLVSIDAQDVTIRQILAAWARVGKTQIINLERVSGGPITIKLEGVPEKQALDIILRSVPGYIALPRESFVADASVYDRVLIMATTTAVAAVRAQTPTFAPTFPGFRGGANITQLRPGMPPGPFEPPGDPQDDPALAAAAAAGLVAVPALTPGPSPVLMMPEGVQQSPPFSAAPATPSNPWNAPAGTSTPGYTPPPAPPATPQMMRPRPPQTDQ